MSADAATATTPNTKAVHRDAFGDSLGRYIPTHEKSNKLTSIPLGISNSHRIHFELISAVPAKETINKTGSTNHINVAPVRAACTAPRRDASAARISRITGMAGNASTCIQQALLILATPPRNTVSHPSSNTHSHLESFSCLLVSTQKHSAPTTIAVNSTVIHPLRPTMLKIDGMSAVNSHAFSCVPDILFCNPLKPPRLLSKHEQAFLLHLQLP